MDQRRSADPAGVAGCRGRVGPPHQTQPRIRSRYWRVASNHLLRPLMTGQSFPTTVLGLCAKFTLAGPLCTSLDRVSTGRYRSTCPLMISCSSGRLGPTPTRRP